MDEESITVLIALRGDGSVRAVMSDTKGISVVLDRTDTDDPPELREADFAPTIVLDRKAEAEEEE